jgi:hypothetical protein
MHPFLAYFVRVCAAIPFSAERQKAPKLAPALNFPLGGTHAAAHFLAPSSPRDLGLPLRQNKHFAFSRL